MPSDDTLVVRRRIGRPAPRRRLPLIPIALATALVGSAAGNIYQGAQLSEARKSLASTKLQLTGEKITSGRLRSDLAEAENEAEQFRSSSVTAGMALNDAQMALERHARQARVYFRDAIAPILARARQGQLTHDEALLLGYALGALHFSAGALAALEHKDAALTSQRLFELETRLKEAGFRVSVPKK